jgi:hypothetical protein
MYAGSFRFWWQKIAYLTNFSSLFPVFVWEGADLVK